MLGMGTPSALAFSQSMSSWYCGSSSSPLAHGSPVDELEIEAGRIAELEHGGRRECRDLGAADGPEKLVGARDDRIGRVIAFAPSRAPAFQADERESRPLAMPAETETADGETRLYPALLQKVGAQLVEHLFSDLHWSARRRHHLGEQHTLVLIGQERLGNPDEQHAHQDHDD